MTNFARRPIALLATLMLAGLAACAESAPEDDTMAETDTPQASAMGARLLNPNTASAEELMAVPGLDSAAVAMIMERRPFDNMLPLNEALSESMDSAALEDVYRNMFIPLDLNSASEEEILLIPGVGSRMVHEFEEYRPYDGGMAEFRREIGKYVDDAEVARLEQYVTIR